MDSAKKITKLSFLIAFAVLFGIAVVILRGPHISNTLKRLVLPEIEMATGHKVIAQNMYINIFPLFVEAKELKMFDEEGQRLVYAKRVKAYLDISGIFYKKLKIRRLVIKDPDLTFDNRKLDEIIRKIREYLSQQRKDKIQVEFEVIEIQRGKAEYFDEGLKTKIGLNDFSGEIITGKAQQLRTAARKVTVWREGLPEVSAAISSDLSLKDSTLQINKLLIESFGSQLSGSGKYAEDELEGKITLKLLVRTIKELFHLERSGDGWLDAKGDISYKNKEISLDLKLSGEFYLQTLMELLKVEEKIEGLVGIQGEIKGELKNIKGAGTAILHKGNLYDVDIDYLKSAVSYADGVMRFTDGQGKLYHGAAKVSASIALPVVDYFTLDINFINADSKPLFKLIGWDPGVPAGKVSGVLHHAGAEFSPKGDFEYVSSETGKDMLGRVKKIAGGYDFKGDLLTLSDVSVKTGRTEVMAGGDVDVNKGILNLQAMLKTADVTDLTLPYYTKFRGTGEITGKIQGTFQDPVISVKAAIAQANIVGYPAGIITGEMIYRKDLLQVKEIRAEARGGTHVVTGTISFRDAKELFDLAHPLYHLRASVKRADMEQFVKVFYPDFVGGGTFTSSLRVEGSGESPDIHGDVSIEKAVIYKVPVDSASFDFAYTQSRFEFRRASVKKGESIVKGNLTIHPDDTFSYKATSDRIRLSDIIQRPLQGEVVLSLRSEGSGSVSNPSITIDAHMTEGTLRGKAVGEGAITASLRGKEFSISARLLDEKISVTAKGRTDGVMPWEATADFQKGRYDFLITSVLKDVPEDLILNLNGNLSISGTRNHIAGTAEIKHMILSMYGYSFTNEDEISLHLKDREISVDSIAMRSGNTLLSTGGTLTIGRNYNIIIEGSSALSPFKSLSTKLGVLRGNADFVVGITGEWEKPKINGSITLVDGSIGLKEYPAYRITDLNGYLYMDNDRVVLQHLGGKIGGGDLDFSGILYLKRFSLSRFYVEAKMKNVTSSISNDFSVNFGGSLLYKGTPEAQMISGNIDINRARYRERVEWKSWLLQTKKAETFKADISNLAKADLNIKITGENNIIIDNNVARAVVGADLVVRGKIYRPSLLGRLETREGKVFFRNNEFNILQASADFSDPNRLNPSISIAADTIVKGYKVKMNLEGQLDRFNMSLSSDPPLKEMDILALLTVGQTGSGVKGLEAGIGAGEATSFVTGKMQDIFEERLRSITGLDRFQVDPHVSKSTGTVEPRVTVSKRLLGDRVYVTYTTAVGTLEEQIIKLEYFMNKNISLVGERDERGITGGDIRFRFEFK